MLVEEINRLNERLRERGVDIETERKMEQVCKQVFHKKNLPFNS